MIRGWFALVVVVVSAALAAVLGAGESADAYDYDLVSTDGVAVSQPGPLVSAFARAGAVDSSAGSVAETRLRPADDFDAPNGPLNAAGEAFDGVPDVIYRGGSLSPSNLTPRPSDQGMLSFRDSLSNPWPLPPGQRPPLPAGKPYFPLDTDLLPPGSVIPDGVPPGHVSVFNVDPAVLREAVIEASRGKFPK